MPTSRVSLDELKQLEERIGLAFDSSSFEKQAQTATEFLKGYLDQSANRERPVWPSTTPDDLLSQWPAPDATPLSDFDETLKGILDASTWQHHPGFIGQQISVPPPIVGPVAMLSAIVNNSSAIFAGAPIGIALEHRIVTWMAEKIGYDNQSAGILASGGTLGALTALLAMRQAKTDFDCWGEGVGQQRVAIFVSEESHYCNRKACAVMGLGEQAAISVPTDESFRMKISSLESLYGKAMTDNIQPIGVVANGCSTATGSYDDLEAIAGFCKQRDLWLHVDGAHGGSALLSPRYAPLLKGIEQADSVVWDAHKLMLMPNVCTAVLFRNEKYLDETFRQNASYLLSQDGESWQQPAARSFETTKPTMVLPLYVALRTLGPQFFADVIDHAYGLARVFANELEARDDFEYLIRPESNIVCFRRTQAGDSAEIQLALRERINAKGKFFIMRTTLRGEVWLRIVFMNPMTKMEHLNELLDELSQLAV